MNFSIHTIESLRATCLSQKIKDEIIKKRYDLGVRFYESDSEWRKILNDMNHALSVQDTYVIFVNLKYNETPDNLSSPVDPDELAKENNILTYDYYKNPSTIVLPSTNRHSNNSSLLDLDGYEDNDTGNGDRDEHTDEDGDGDEDEHTEDGDRDEHTEGDGGGDGDEDEHTEDGDRDEHTEDDEDDDGDKKFWGYIMGKFQNKIFRIEHMVYDDVIDRKISTKILVTIKRLLNVKILYGIIKSINQLFVDYYEKIAIGSSPLNGDDPTEHIIFIN